MTRSEEIGIDIKKEEETEEIKQPDRFTSKVFRMSRVKFFHIMILKDGLQVTCILLGLLAAGLLLSLFLSWIYFISSLLLIFLIVPPALMLQYFSAAMKPMTLLNTSPHYLRLEGSALKVIMTEPEREISIAFSEIIRTEFYAQGAILSFNKKSNGWIWIPEAAFDDRENFSFYVNQFIQPNNCQ